MPVWVGPFKLSEKSKIGFILSTLVSLVFAGVGIGLLVYAYLQYQEGGLGQHVYVMGGIGAMFAVMGLLNLRSALRSRGQAKELASLKEKYAETPWKVRPNWRSSEVPEREEASAVGAFFAVLWNLVAWPGAAYLIYSEFAQPGEPEWAVLLVLLFPLVGIGIGWAVGSAFMRRRKYGRSTCMMETMPGRLGQYLAARVQTGMNAAEAPEEGFHVQLSCYRRYIRYTTDSDGDRKRKVEKDLKWRDEKHVRGKPYGAQNKLEVPISFKLPEDGRPSTPEKSEERILWQLDVSADVPGLDYKSSFELPVFEADEETVPSPDETSPEAAEDKTPAADPGNVFWDLEDERAQQLTHDEGSAPETAEAERDPYADYEVGDEFTEPETEGITMTRTPSGGLQFAFDPTRNRSSAILFGVIGVACLAGTFFILPNTVFGGLILLAMGAIMVYGAGQTWTKRSVITVDEGQVEVETQTFGRTSTESFACDQVISVRVEIASNSGSAYSLNVYRADPEGRKKIEQSEEKLDQVATFIEQTGVMGEKPDDADDPFKHIKNAVKKHGQIVQVVDNLSDKQEADWMAKKIQRAARREAQFS